MTMNLELDAHHQRLWDYANLFMYEHVKDEKHLQVFLASLQKIKNLSEKDVDFLRKCWILTHTGECSSAETVELTTMTREEVIYQDVEDSVIASEFSEEEPVEAAPKKRGRPEKKAKAEE